MSDDIKQAAEHCAAEKSCYQCVRDCIGAKCTRDFARAYLALREQVETAIPSRSLTLGALRRATSFVSWMLRSNIGNGAIEHEGEPLIETLRAAIKAIEEGRG